MRSTSLSDATSYSGVARATARQRAGLEDASPTTLPSASFLTCSTRALLPLAMPLPLADEPLVGLFGVTGQVDLPITQLFDIVCVGGAPLVSLPSRLPSLQLYGAQFIRDQRRARPLVVGVFGQQMPAQPRPACAQRRRRRSDGRDGRGCAERMRAADPGAVAAAQAASTNMARA
jgi:hypothetical protein